MQLSLFPEDKNASLIPVEELFQAYRDCRQNKRNTANALAFEIDYENNLIKLGEEINNGTYRPGKSIAFIVNKPVMREIFAADFKDRVVHHLLINKLNPLLKRNLFMTVAPVELIKGLILLSGA